MNRSASTRVQILTGNHAVAYAVKACDVDVISAYPITPQSPVVEKLIHFVDDGELDSQFVTVESEHSAITVCISASAVGARVFTASCANGLGLMHEMLHWAAGSRLPLVMAIPNRAMAAPWSILNDQQDSISQRDTGWLQIYCRNNQEVYDSIIQAYRIAEEIMAPVMVCYDGYILSHTMMPVEMIEEKQVHDYLPSYKPHTILDPEQPMNINPVTLAEPRENAEGDLCPGYMDLRHGLQEAHLEALDTVPRAGREFASRFGREYGLLDTYRLDGAELVIVSMGSLASEAQDAVDILRDEGLAVGILHVRLYRPFPAKEVTRTLAESGCRGIAVMEKNISYGYEGALATDLKAALFDYGPSLFAHSYIMGLGGRNISTEDVVETARKSWRYLNIPEGSQRKETEWINCCDAWRETK